MTSEGNHPQIKVVDTAEMAGTGGTKARPYQHKKYGSNHIGVLERAIEE